MLKLAASMSLLAASCASAQLCPTHRQQLLASESGVEDRFGTSVAIDGDLIVVGAPYWDGTSGGAYVFRRQPTGEWLEESRLAAPSSANGDYFGGSVSVSAGTIAVGAEERDTAAGSNAGAVFMFARDTASGTWIDVATITAPGGTAYEHFGNAAVVNSNTLIAGCWLDDAPPGIGSGSAYIFAFLPSSETWVPRAMLTAPDAASSDRFGWAVALSGEIALVGVPYDDTSEGLDAGTAHVFVRNANTGVWTHQAQLIPDDGAAGDSFGWSVALDESVAAITAPDDRHGDPSHTGSVYLFHFDDSTQGWTQEAKLTAPASISASIGRSAALDGDVLVVGGGGPESTRGAGIVVVFARANGVWSRVGQLAAPQPSEGDQFGWSLALAGGSVVAGAPLDGTNAGYDAGSAHVFDLSSTPRITAAPTDSMVCLSGTATYSIIATSPTLITYRWQYPDPDAPGGWINLSDGELVIANVPTAFVFGAAAAQVFLSFQGYNTTYAPSSLRCVITNTCGSTESDSGVLTVCGADFDCDGFVTGQDFDGYVAAFEAGDPSSDFDEDGFVTGLDFDAYVEAFEAGC